MITQIRRYLQTIVFRIVLAILTFSLIGWISLPRIFKGWQANDLWLVRVNGTDILPEEFDKQVHQEEYKLSMLSQQLGAYAPQLLKNLDVKAIAYENLVQDQLLNQLALKLDIQTDSQSLMRELIKVLPPSVFDASGNIDQQALLNLMPAYRTISEFEDAMIGSLNRDLVLNISRAAFYLPLFEAKQQYKSTHLPKKYAILSFPFDHYLKKAKLTPVTDKELESFFASESKNPAYSTLQKRTGLVWEFTSESFGVEVNQKMLESYYNRNKRTTFLENPTKIELRHILFASDSKKAPEKEQEIHQRALKALGQVRADPTNFAKVAKEYSDDKKTAQNGGLLPAMGRSEMDKAFESAAFHLRQDGEISDLVKTDKGYEILQRVSRKQETYKSFENVKNEIRNLLLKERFNGAFERTAARVLSYGSLEEKNKALQELIKSKSSKTIKLENKEQDNSLQVAKLFSLKDGGYAFFSEGNKGFIIHLESITKSSLRPLSSIKNEVEQDFRASLAKKMMRDDLDEAKKRLRGPVSSLEKIKEDFGLTVDESSMVATTDIDKDKVLKKLNISSAEIGDLSAVGIFKEVSLGRDSYIIKVMELGSLNFKEMEQKKKTIINQLLKPQMQLFESGFIASLYRSAKITINEKFKYKIKKQGL